MRTMLILMDSLNRHYLSAYGQNKVKTPNLDRFVKRGVVFDNHYVGSAPCIPARRELMTGRLNFLEAPWGPIEPWDDCLPVELRNQKNVYSHMITDHYHYFHSGGEAYHTLFDSWEFIRGQEGDAWHPMVSEPYIPEFKGKNRRNYWVNQMFMNSQKDEDYPTPKCFMKAIDFLESNGKENNWHLHLEVFDPHEPFVCPKKYIDLYDDTWDDKYYFDSPNYAPVKEEEKGEAVSHIQKRYAGVLTMADVWLGKLLDKMNEMDLWKDTVVILTSDHGHLLGEHGFWAKNYMFDYQELMHIPLIISTPDSLSSGKRISSLTSTIDLMPTIMNLHGADVLEQVHGKSLLHLLKEDSGHHEGVLYGYFGKDINLCNGRYSYCRQPLEKSYVYHHTSMPRNINDFIPRDVLKKAQMGVFLKQCYGVPHYRIRKKSQLRMDRTDYNPIFDIIKDPEQKNPICDKELEKKLAQQMKKLMIKYDSPECQFERLDL